MLTILIIAILIYSFYTGYRRGIMMQIIRFIGYAVSMVIANRFYMPLSRGLSMFVPFPSVQQNTQLAFYNEMTSFVLDQAFYRAISFMVIAFAGWLLTNFFSLFFSRLMFYDVLKWVNHLAGGLLNLAISFFIVFCALFILSLIPVEAVQQQFVDNPIAFRIVSSTPILTDFATKTWLQINPF